MPDLISEIKTELKRQKRSRYWLAKQIGVQPSSIYRMLNPKRGRPSLKHLEAMLEALKIK